jgi:inner membrane protein
MSCHRTSPGSGTVVNMHVQTHLMASWAIGCKLTERRDRRLVAWAGVAPDIDSVSLLFGLDRYIRWHHVLTHNLLAAVVTAGVVAAVAKERGRAAVLAFVAFHVHFVLDTVGSGPGWQIAYFYPFSSTEYGVGWAWDLASWQNLVATVTVLAVSVVTAVALKRSFVETWAPASVDAAFCGLVSRVWSGMKGS